MNAYQFELCEEEKKHPLQRKWDNTHTHRGSERKREGWKERRERKI